MLLPLFPAAKNGRVRSTFFLTAPKFVAVVCLPRSFPPHSLTRRQLQCHTSSSQANLLAVSRRCRLTTVHSLCHSLRQPIHSDVACIAARRRAGTECVARGCRCIPAPSAWIQRQGELTDGSSSLSLSATRVTRAHSFACSRLAVERAWS